MGYQGYQYLLGWTGGFVLLALLLAPYLRKFGKFTVPDFIGERYYSQTARVVAVICALFISFTYVIGQMKGVGVAFSRFLEIDYNYGVMIGVFIVFFYAVLGGMKGDYLHPGGAVCRIDFCLSDTGYFYQFVDGQSSGTPAGFGWATLGRHVPAGQTGSAVHRSGFRGLYHG